MSCRDAILIIRANLHQSVASCGLGSFYAVVARYLPLYLSLFTFLIRR